MDDLRDLFQLSQFCGSVTLSAHGLLLPQQNPPVTILISGNLL